MDIKPHLETNARLEINAIKLCLELEPSCTRISRTKPPPRKHSLHVVVTLLISATDFAVLASIAGVAQISPPSPFGGYGWV
jgi:hypothetical protein